MALRSIVTQEDEILRKESKDVKNFGARTNILLDDMWETMRAAGGVGLAAPQVGVLRRAIVIDVTPEEDENADNRHREQSGAADESGTVAENEAIGSAPSENAVPVSNGVLTRDSVRPSVNAPSGTLYELINPVVILSEGEVCEKEGCLSVPGTTGSVKRPKRMKVSAFDRDGNEVVVDGKGMLAKALSHEIDHLNGVLFTDIADEIEDAEHASQE